MGKLEGGKTKMEGKAMVNINGQWGSICDVTPLKSQWPTLLCQYLGYDDIKVKRKSRKKHMSSPGCYLAQWPVWALGQVDACT